MSAPFEFKQFTLYQGKAAFKLGTDSVVLGCWLPGKSYKKVLDLGAGTGILSLILAQRFEPGKVVAIEIDQASAEDCANNFTLSRWKEELILVNDDLMNWSVHHPTEKFDLVITNPPYFTNSLKNLDERKSLARHSTHFNAETLADFLPVHLSSEGKLGIILPTTEFARVVKILNTRNIYLNQVCHLSSHKQGEIIRELGIFSMKEQKLVEETQYLYHSDKSRSDWYKTISKDFYIK